VALMQRYSREGYSRVLQAVDVFESARDVVSMLQAGVTSKLVETAFDGDGRLECVPEEMHQVLTNLIQNALDAIQPETGKVRVSGHIESGTLVLSVADNGSGISPEHRARIFTPFYTTKDVGAGMGLGLTIVHRVVTSLGGIVSVTSQEGCGSEFTLRVPQRAPRLHAHAVHPPGDVQRSGPQPRPGRESTG
jgi:two-component system NtrC family sensor kinase